MTNLLISIGIGAVAGIIDVIPMLIQKLDKFSNGSAFVHWMVLGVIISYIQVPLAPWRKALHMNTLHWFISKRSVFFLFRSLTGKEKSLCASSEAGGGFQRFHEEWY